LCKNLFQALGLLLGFFEVFLDGSSQILGGSGLCHFR